MSYVSLQERPHPCIATWVGSLKNKIIVNQIHNIHLHNTNYMIWTIAHVFRSYGGDTKIISWQIIQLMLHTSPKPNPTFRISLIPIKAIGFDFCFFFLPFFLFSFYGCLSFSLVKCYAQVDDVVGLTLATSCKWSLLTFHSFCLFSCFQELSLHVGIALGPRVPPIKQVANFSVS